MRKSTKGPTLQPYPREDGGSLLSKHCLFPKTEAMDKEVLSIAIDEAFNRCKKDKKEYKTLS